MTETATAQETRTEHTHGKGWAKGALIRGFYSVVQAYHATNLSVIMLAPTVAKAFQFEKLVGNQDQIKEKIAKWEERIQKHDIRPLKPNFMKAAARGTLYTLTYLAPIIALGVAAGNIGGPDAALIFSGIVNTHAIMGEAFVRSARTADPTIHQKQTLDRLMQDPEFAKNTKIHVSVMGGVCLGILLAAGPLSRLLGGFTSGPMKAFSKTLSKTPVGGLISDNIIKIANQSAVKALRKPLGRLFSAAVQNGPAMIAARRVVLMTFARAAASKLADWFNRRAENVPKPAIAQDNDPMKAVANDNDRAEALRNAPVIVYNEEAENDLNLPMNVAAKAQTMKKTSSAAQSFEL